MNKIKHFKYQFGDGNRVYLASPMFSQAEKDYNLKIAHVLEEYGYEVLVMRYSYLKEMA